MSANTPLQTATVSSDETTPSSSTLGSHQSTTRATDRSMCPECGQQVPSVDVDEAVCPTCDVCIGDPVQTAGPRWYDAQERRQKKRTAGRVTALYADQGIGTHNDPIDRQWTNDRTSSEYRLAYALGEIRRMASAFDLPAAVRQDAARLYRLAADEGVIEGRTIEGFAAASLLIAIRKSTRSIPISERELQEPSRVEAERIRTARAVYEVRLGIQVSPMKPHAFLPKAVSELDAPRLIERCARRLLDARAADDEECRSFSPRTLAATAIYVAYELVDTSEIITLAAVAGVLDVSETTISHRKSHLLEYAEAWRPDCQNR